MSDASVQHDEGLESLVARVADEFLEQCRRGEGPDVEEYAARYPEAAALLRKVLASLEVLGLSAEGLVAAPADEIAGTGTLGDFRLVREIGRGGMGVVYEAEQMSLGRRVALKVLPFAATMDARQMQRFHNEARAAASLHHEHIVPVYAVGCERGVHFYAMQFIEGRSLAELIAVHDPARRGRPPSEGGAGPDTRTVAAAATEARPRDAAYFRRVAEWGIQAAEALEHAHALGIVHRDVKPANLIVDDWGKLWVTDFGLARTATDAGLTMSGDLLGTLRYMSPEQALARHGLVDHRTDVYSLGATLSELLTGRPAVEGEDRQVILKRIAEEEPRPPGALDREVPTDLETIVLKSLAKEPAERYATARELAEDLRRFLDNRPIQARRPSAAQVASRWVRRHRAVVWAALGGLVFAVAALAVSVVLVWREVGRTRDALAEEARQRRRADEAATTSDAHQRRAEANLRQALEEVIIHLDKLDAPRWSGDAQVREVRRLIAADALAFLRGLVTEEDPDPGAQEQAGVVYVYMGHVYTSMGDMVHGEEAYRKAIAAFGRMAAAHPEEPLWHFELGQVHNILGMRLHTAGRVQEADAEFRDALASYRRNLTLSGNARAFTMLAWFLVTCQNRTFHRPAEALTLVNKALEQDPRNGDSLCTRGIALYRLRRYHEAIDTLKEALGRPLADDCQLCLFLAMACWQLSREAEARDWYRRALRAMAETENSDRMSRGRFRAEAEEVMGIAPRQAQPN
jgi:tetratricopeptide (TPR) repeat protein